MTADTDVRFAAFEQLGRTDKSVASFEANDIATPSPVSNVRGRYSFHLHRTGALPTSGRSVVVGNAVFNSPGWGYVHHDSNAIFHNNASFDTFGAGFVAETGNEIGSWTNNIAIKAEGNRAFNPKNGNEREAFDMGRTGDGFWFQGRMVRSVRNVAASVNHGFVYLHRGSGMLSFPNTAFMLPEALSGGRPINPDDAPIRNFHQNESFASTVGLYVVKANPNQQHDVHSHLSQFTAWNVIGGAAVEYTSHYLLEDFDLVAAEPEAFRAAAFGIDLGTNTTDVIITGANIASFPIGISLAKDFTDPTVLPEANQYVVVGAQFDQVATPYDLYDPAIDLVLNPTDLTPGQMAIDLNDGQPLEYLSPATSAGSGVSYQGQKIDAIGTTPIPAGTDAIGTPAFDMISILETEGYYRASDGQPYAVIEEYFTERATGQVHKFGLKTWLGPNLESALGNQFSAWADAFERGPIDLSSAAPIANDDNVQIEPESAVIIAVLSNDSDPESEPLTVDGVVQPNHGEVIDNGDGTLTYLPDIDYSGLDQFQYWATDGQGNYSAAQVRINVVENELFSDGFE